MSIAVMSGRHPRAGNWWLASPGRARSSSPVTTFRRAASVLAPQEYHFDAANLGAMQITPDGKDVVIASGAPYYQQVYRVSDLSPDGTYPTTYYPNSVSIAAGGC
jgi:hypothetical protein